MDMGETEGPFALEKEPSTMKILRALKTHKDSKANPIEISKAFLCGPMLLWCAVYMMTMECVDLLLT
jgi:hypothetical protein